MIRIVCTVLLVLTACVGAQEYYRKGTKVQLTPVAATPPHVTAAVQSAKKDSIAWYTTEQGSLVGVTQEVLVTWKDISQKEAVLAQFPIVKRDDISSTITLLSFSSSADVFSLSQQLYEHPATKSAQPNLIQEKVRR